MGCAPSRASMHYGRYPFRAGVYEFEYHNNNAEHCKPTCRSKWPSWDTRPSMSANWESVSKP